ncbi:chromosome segregation protein [Amorphus suaedae]
MRFERLSLLRYGALADREIVFRPGAKLHVVYGPNEAGKSSALAAISDLLFGFPHLTAYDFRHDSTALRVGATLVSGSGERLSFRRRKGRKATLISDSDDESELRDDALAPFLGSLTRDVFERAFGLDSERLRQGADDMLKSDGELGSLLFSAASGLAGLTTLKTSLEDEAGAIFAPRKSKDRRFYQILDRHEAARKAERESELRATDWKALNTAIDDLQARYDALAAERTTARRAAARLERLRQLRPIVAEIDADEAALASHADLACLPAGHAAALEECLATLERAAAALERAEDQARRQADALGRVEVDERLVAQAEEIFALIRESGDHESKLRDLPRIEAERDNYDAELRQYADRLGIADADLEGRLPTDAVLADLKSLVEEGRRLAAAASGLDDQITEARAELDEVRARRPAGALNDPKPWRDRFAALAPDIAPLARRDQLEADRRALHRDLEARLARLSPPVPDLDRLAATPPPQPDTLRRAQEAFAGVDAELAALDRRAAELADELDRLDREIAAAEQAGPVPSRIGIAEARTARDTAFAGLADIVEGRTPLPAPAEAAGRVADATALTRAADAAADGALADATRLHEQETRLRTRADVRNNAQKSAKKRSETESARARIEADYRAHFSALGIEPEAPQRMLDWLRSVEDILALRRQAQDLEDGLTGLDAAAARLRPALQAIATGAGLDDAGDLPVPALARAIEARLAERAEDWSERRAHAVQTEDRERRLGSLTDKRAAVAETEADWASRFRAALATVGLPETAGLERTAATIALWEKVPDIRRERANRARRVDGMRRDIARFEERVSALVGEAAPDLAGLPAAHAIEALSERTQGARTADAQRRSAQAALADAQAELARARDAHAAALADRDRLVAAAPDGMAPAELLRRLRIRDEVALSLEKCRHRLSEVAVGSEEDAVRHELRDFDPEQAAIEVATLEREEARIDQDMNEVFAALSERKRERDRLDAAAGAERAAFERNMAEAEILEAGREWAVLKLASALLSAAMDQHRQSQDDPLMARAGRLFSTLTAGYFAGIAQQFGKEDRPELVGIRASGERVAIPGLSDGTRDQLYLALRLAFLEDYAARNEPAPFIGDDIFQTFDDARTAAGLTALAEASETVQPILFTHARSVVEIARSALGDDADIIMIDGQTTP